MAINIECPFCHKPYKLRDELLGKRVTCANTECRKIFPVNAQIAATNGSASVTKTAPPPAPALAKPTPAAESETVTQKPAPAKPAEKKPTEKKPEEKKPEAKKPAEKKPPEKKPTPKKPAEAVPDVDAETLAASLFSDEAAAKPAEAEDTRTIEVMCTSCDHKWNEPFAKQGKLMLCPECKHRVKVPEIKKEKKIDWRDPNANRPTLAKGEEIPDDLKEQQTTNVSIGALSEAGAIEAPAVEPRPLKQKVFFVVGALSLVVVFVVVAMLLIRSRSEKREEQFMPMALKKASELTDDDLPKTQAPLVKAIVDIAAGEHAARAGKDKAKRDEAVRHFAAARTELEAAPKSLERELITAELGFALLALGGTDQQALAETHLRWVPSQAQTNKPRINADITNVQAELRRVLVLLRREGQGADFELRALVARKLAVELAKRGQPDLLEEIIAQGFKDTEMPEALAQLALEYHRSKLGLDAKVKAIAEQVKSLIVGNPGTADPVPTSAVALWQVLDTPTKDIPTIASPPGNGDVSQATRMSYAVLNAYRDNPAEAATLVGKNGSFGDKLRAAALAAEFAYDPAPILTVAADIATKEQTPAIRAQAITSLARLAFVAARAKDSNTANALVGAIPDDAARVWATVEVNRLIMQSTGKQKPELGSVVKPESGGLKAGHAWSALTVARQHGMATEEAKDVFGTWDKVQQVFGLAGLALGLQDAKLK